MKSDLPVLASAPPRARFAAHEGLGYPWRPVIVCAGALALGVTWLVALPERDVAWLLTAGIVLAMGLLAGWHASRLSRARHQGARVLAALGEATAAIPVRLRTRMPLVLVTGDALHALFDREDGEHFAHVGDGAIWLRVDRPQDLPPLAVAVRQWRDGRAPDGVVLSVVPARHRDTDALTQSLRVVRQAAADAARLLGSAALPGYVAVYQRLTYESDPDAAAGLAAPRWYGVSSATRIVDAQRFEPVIRAAESETPRTAADRATATRAAALASIVGWTQRVVLHALTERHQAAAPWALFGAGWIDCGPASGPDNPWARDVYRQTRVQRVAAAASAAPWPLPQPLLRALPQRRWMSPRTAACAHVLALLGCAALAAFWASARHNAALLTRVGADLERYAAIPAPRDAARRDALQTLVADRDELDRYARLGVPPHLSLGLYRGAALMPALDDAIAAYVPPPPPPSIVTLDSMSLFDSGEAQLKPGSTRALVTALDMIRAHPDKRILVAGYTDNVGSPRRNLALSTARAQAVRDWLTGASRIPATQFAIQGYGDTRPIATNDTAAGRAKNRRVEITLVPDAGTALPQDAAAPAPAPGHAGPAAQASPLTR